MNPNASEWKHTDKIDLLRKNGNRIARQAMAVWMAAKSSWTIITAMTRQKKIKRESIAEKTVDKNAQRPKRLKKGRGLLSEAAIHADGLL